MWNPAARLYSPHRNVFSKHSGVPVGLFFFEKPPGSLRSPCRTEMFFKTFRCSGPFFRKTSAFSPKRLQVRFAHPPMPHRNVFSKHSGVPVGLFFEKALQLFLQNARPPGSLRSPSDAAPKCFFKTFRCSGRLIFRKSSSAFLAPGSLRSPSDAAPKCFFKTFRCSGRLIFRKSSSAFSPKRSTSRFASLTLRCRTEMFFQNIPVFRSAYFSKKLFSFFSKTLDLQVRFAHPPMPHRNVFSKHSGVPVGLFFEKALQLFLQNARPPGSLRSPSDAAPKCFSKHSVFRSAFFFRKALQLFSSKISTSRFASLTPMPRNVFSKHSAGRLIFGKKALQLFFLQNPRPGSLRSPYDGRGSFAPPCTPLSCPRRTRTDGQAESALDRVGRETARAAEGGAASRSGRRHGEAGRAVCLCRKGRMGGPGGSGGAAAPPVCPAAPAAGQRLTGGR